MKLLVILSLLGVALGVSSIQGIDLDSILVRSVGGPEALDSVKALSSVFYRGTATMGGLEGEIRVWVVPSNKYLLEFDSPAFAISRGFDGHIAWEKDQNGRVSELSGLERDLIEKSAYFESFSYLIPGRIKGTRQYLGVQRRGQTDYHVVSMVPKEGDSSVLYLDAVNGLCEVTETHLGRDLLTSSVGDYRSVSGILVPFVQRDTLTGMPGASLVMLEQVDINLPIDPVVFSKPVSASRDFHFPPDVSRVTIPFSYVGSQIFVQATLNGKVTVYLLLDSGASGNIYYRPAIEALALPIAGYVPVQGAAANDSAALVLIDSVSVGELTLYHQVAGLMEHSAIGQLATGDAKFGGVLGYDFLSRFPVLIDYRRFELTVFNPDQFDPPVGGSTIPFRLTMKVPTVTAEVCGVKGDFILDLGNAIGLILHDGFVRGHQPELQLANVRDYSKSMLGVGGAIAMRVATAGSFILGEHRFDSASVFLPESAAGLSSSSRIDGNIGNPILEQFRVLLDYGHSRVILYSARSKDSPAN